MATVESNDANILDAETVNWRLIVYPALVVLILVVGGFSIYYYQQLQRENLEAKAREAMLQAKTPEELVKVADDFPGSDQATMALLSAAQGSLDKKDFSSALKDYQRVVDAGSTTPLLRDAAQLGLGFSLAATGKQDDAIKAYTVVAERGDKSPYAPYAYVTIAGFYNQRGDKDNERKVLTAAAGLDPESQFVKQAQDKLKQLSAAAAQPPQAVTPTPAPASAPVPMPTPVPPPAAK